KNGEAHYYVVASYDRQRKVYLEVHIDILGLLQSFAGSGKRLELFVVSGPVVFFQWKNLEGYPVEIVSPNVRELLGYSAEEFLNKILSYEELVHPKDKEIILKEMEYHAKRKSSYWRHTNYILRRKDGAHIWVLDYTVPLLDKNGEITGYYGYIIDIAEKHEQEELLQVLAESNPYAVLIYDFTENKVLYANTNTEKLSGYSVEELLKNENPLNLIYEKDRGKVIKNLTARKEGYFGNISYRLRIITKDKKIKWVELSSVVSRYRGKFVSVLTFKDISQDIKRERELTILANRDQLTKVFNRHALIHEFERLLSQAKRYNQPLSVIILDIDDFKSINDTYGHILGDKVLKDIARVVRRTLRKSDIFGRWGGEEFLAILPMTSNPYIPAEKVRLAVEEYWLKNNMKITISLGASVYKKGDTMNSLISRADQALYRAKAEGKNRTVVI
ncbi:MAG: diguanylate cyclase, partial [Aquificaceae bacterium]|nr:diguanylate cyclase [Aquificaceae bacterium]